MNFIVIKIKQLSKANFARELVTDVTFQMIAGERPGPVGRSRHPKEMLFTLRFQSDD